MCVCVFSHIVDECSAVHRGLQGRPEDLTQVYILLGRRSDVNELHKKVPGWLLSPPPGQRQLGPRIELRILWRKVPHYLLQCGRFSKLSIAQDSGSAHLVLFQIFYR